MPRGSATARRAGSRVVRRDGGEVTWMIRISIEGQLFSVSHLICLLYEEKSSFPVQSMVATLIRFVNRNAPRRWW